MMYRKWSLLTATVAITGSIVAAVVVGNLLFVENDPFLKPQPRKQDTPSTKVKEMVACVNRPAVGCSEPVKASYWVEDVGA
ncbi:hypothetical protein Nepgr_002275 [Nepenthes gracilis]|uniref:Uncharacterized protein n=1 Tax=Nepenthes gracilis TaxID=150966 RepID=A0AAD3P6K3_NEPGR|nr:hypothetical protein Nepgr_002275 [Nepenthes gracilis]